MSAAVLSRALRPQQKFIYMFILTILIQALHMVEHIAHFLQKFVLHSTTYLMVQNITSLVPPTGRNRPGTNLQST